MAKSAHRFHNLIGAGGISMLALLSACSSGGPTQLTPPPASIVNADTQAGCPQQKPVGHPWYWHAVPSFIWGDDQPAPNVICTTPIAAPAPTAEQLAAQKAADDAAAAAKQKDLIDQAVKTARQAAQKASDAKQAAAILDAVMKLQAGAYTAAGYQDPGAPTDQTVDPVDFANQNIQTAIKALKTQNGADAQAAVKLFEATATAATQGTALPDVAAGTNHDVLLAGRDAVAKTIGDAIQAVKNQDAKNLAKAVDDQFYHDLKRDGAIGIIGLLLAAGAALLHRRKVNKLNRNITTVNGQKDAALAAQATAERNLESARRSANAEHAHRVAAEQALAAATLPKPLETLNGGVANDGVTSFTTVQANEIHFLYNTALLPDSKTSVELLNQASPAAGIKLSVKAQGDRAAFDACAIRPEGVHVYSHEDAAIATAIAAMVRVNGANFRIKDQANASPETLSQYARITQELLNDGDLYGPGNQKLSAVKFGDQTIRAVLRPAPEQAPVAGVDLEATPA